MKSSKHKIQILTLREEKNQRIIKTVGFVYVEDKKQILFNPSIKGYRKGHWTWHKNGKGHYKDNKGKVIFKFKRIPLDKFKGQRQFLFSGSAKNTNFNLDYKLCEDAAIFLIDLRQFMKGLGLSIHACDYWNVNKTMKLFKDKPRHQSFVYWKSNPKIVIIAFDN